MNKLNNITSIFVVLPSFSAGTVTNYCYDGDLLISETTEDRIIVYLYDVTGSPVGMQYRDGSYAYGEWDVYWYAKNLLGDIVSVYNDEGVEQLTYKYVAGGHTQIKTLNGGRNTPVEYNPFMYRGYYYDADLDLYYLQSRYYDYVNGRFLNADKFVSTGQGLLGHNMYAYCNNDPINYKDETGEILLRIVAAITVAVMCRQAADSADNPPIEPDESVVDDLYLHDPEKSEASIEGKINVRFSPEGSNPSFQIENSYKITDPAQQMAILQYIMDSEYYSQETYGRSLGSMMIEWDAHNDIYFVSKHERVQHTDFDKNDEGVIYLAFWIRAIKEYMKQ